MKKLIFLLGIVTGITCAVVGKKAKEHYDAEIGNPTFTKADAELIAKMRSSLNAVRRSHNKVLEVMDYHGYLTYTGSDEEVAKLEV